MVVAGLSIASFVFSFATGQADWSMMLNGIVVALSGFQVLNAREALRHTAPAEIRGWMRPAGYAMYGLSVPFFAFGILAVIHLAAAT